MVRGLSVVSSSISKKNKVRCDTVLMKSHSMNLRSFGVCSNLKIQNSEIISMEIWNLEEEVMKVLEKGLAIGLNFNGRKKELLEIIARREEENDDRFRDLVRSLVQKHKATGF
ncbi:hypothetical protein Dsin_005129 [Dipteronia sinensis]|uniref:Uncharacterized protein n=1 Tax=Dipteronia sinensis TaxID=43782 RepID=A0AAE0AX90_9ROSI|nr:hypothetical protein Dsin_005129 [Dipteronia sinensis]